MIENGTLFNINTLLKNVYQTLEAVSQDGSPNLIFNFSKNLPSEMRGEVRTLYMLLLKTLQVIIHADHETEIVIFIDAPKDFLYKEVVTFEISNISMKEEAIVPKLQKLLAEDLEKLNATLIFSEEHGGSIEIKMELLSGKLGCRRHYRLPSKSILNKDILLLVESNNLAISLSKMFKYFPMHVEVKMQNNKEDWNMAHFDLVVMEDTLLDVYMYDAVAESKQKCDAKFVLLGNKEVYGKDDNSKLHDAFLEKPITQDSVFRLLIELFEEPKTI